MSLCNTLCLSNEAASEVVKTSNRQPKPSRVKTGSCPWLQVEDVGEDGLAPQVHGNSSSLEIYIKEHSFCQFEPHHAVQGGASFMSMFSDA